MTKEVYIAGSISRKAEREWHSQISKKLVEMGAETYAPGDNDKINDKRNNPTPVDIYDGDVARLLSCDVFLCELHGGKQDGTIWECGWVSAWNEMNEKLSTTVDDIFDDEKEFGSKLKALLDSGECDISDIKEIVKEGLVKNGFRNKEMYFYTTNSRLLHNAEVELNSIKVPSESLNHLVLGGFLKWSGDKCFLGSDEEMLEHMEEII